MIIAVSFRDWVVETYGLKDFKGNRSGHIEACFIKGFELKSGEFSEVKTRLLSSYERIKALEEELAEARAEIGLLNQKVKKKVKAVEEVTKMGLREKQWWQETIKLIKMSPHFLEGRHRLYQNEFARRLTVDQFEVKLEQVKTMEGE